MPRVNRVDVANQIYHVLNRANARMQIFDSNKDYQLFESVIEEAKNYLKYLNEPQNENEEKAIQNSILRGSPYGEDGWRNKVIKKFKLESTVKTRGRPKKGS